MSKMNPEIKAKWVAALRSGKYRQTKNRLQSEDGSGMCCLGVLCDIVDPGGWGKSHFGLSHLGHVDTPAGSVRKQAGFPLFDGDDACYEIPQVFIGGEIFPLWKHNDDGRTFAEIADAIEAQL